MTTKQVTNDSSPGPHWAAMNRGPRLLAATLRRQDIPVGPGVYAWYDMGNAVYVGKADSLLERIWDCHLAQHPSMGNSALRRNVAEHLGFGTAADIKRRACKLTPDQVAAVNARVQSWSVAWIVCASSQMACHLESAMKIEWLPPFTRR